MADDNMNNLFQALQMFNSGVQQAATTSAINDASQAMRDLNGSMLEDAQKRQQQDQLARDLSLRLTGIGAPASAVENAFQAVAPQRFGSVEQMQLEGELAGNKQYQDVSKKILSQRAQAKKDEMAMQFGFESALADKKFMRDMALEQFKLAKSGSKLSPEEVAFQTNVNVANSMLDDLEKTIKDKGTFELGFGSDAAQGASAKLDAIPYQLAITYAKIVDPNSVAREGEVAAAQKYLIQLGAFANEGKALQALKNMRDTIKTYQGSRSQVQGGGAAGAQAQPGVETRRLKDGSIVKVQRQPDGSYIEVP